MLRQILPYMLFVVLLTITIFRKELSTNDEYRSSPRRKGEKPAGAEDSSISRRALEELFELNNHGSRFKTLLNDIAVDMNQGFSLPELKDHFFASLLEGYDAFEFKTLYKLSRRRDRDRDASHLNLKKHDDDDLLGKEKKKKNLDNMSNVVLANVMTYLTYKDICALGSCNVALARDTRSDYIWRKLWFQNFGDMWTQERIANIRKARHIEWDPCKHTDKDKSYRQLSGLSAKDKAESDWRPRQGWFMFFLEFDACWVDWLLAGFCTEDCCLVGIGGNLYDLTAFLPHHPGSMETLTEVCGGEATDHFVDMGHSSHAVGLAKKLMIYSPYSEADFPKPTPTRAPSLDLELDLGPRGMPSLTSPGGGSVDLSPSGLMNGEGESTPTLQSSPTHGARRKTRFSQNHLLHDRYHLPVNAHRRNLITAFQQQIRREQRAMERNAYKWNLRYSTRQEGNGSDKRRSRSGDGGAPRTISEELDFDSFMGPDTLSGPLEPVSEEGRGAESPTGSGKKHQDPCCRRGLPHFGRARAVYDPLKQEYFVWWTCCSTVHSQT